MKKVNCSVFLLVFIFFVLNILIVPSPVLAAKPIFWVFDSSQNQMAAPKHDLRPFLAGKGAAGQWLVIDDPLAPSLPNVYAQLAGDPVFDRFPLAIVRHGSWTDIGLTVKIKILSGKIGQAGGLVFHYQNPKNFYSFQANVLENKVYLYKVLDGVWSQMASTGIPVSGNSWHTLKIKKHGWNMKGYFNGTLLVEAKDNTFAKGRIGLVTKADSIVHFDDLWLQPYDFPLDYPQCYGSIYYDCKKI